MGKLGFCFDMYRCIGCKTCQVACKERNKLPPGVFFRRAETCEVVAEKRKIRFNYSGACNHCAAPACVSACPTGAMDISADSTVLHDDTLCIGCGRCVYACPYGAPTISEITGYAQKCDSCAPLRAAGKGPACVEACPTRALRFGEIEALNAGCDAGGEDVIFLPCAAKTRPAVAIRRAPAGLRLPAPPLEVAAQETDQEAEEAPRDTEETFLILGGGAAAVAAAKAIRKNNRTAYIKIFGDEKTLPYCRPMLSKALLRGFSMRNHMLVTEEWAKDRRIEIFSGRRVISMDTAERYVTLDKGERVPYDKCIYALGAESFVPPVPGVDKRGVFTIRRREDIRRLRTALISAKHGVVVGGGAIGLEIAWQLKKSGMEVTVVEGAETLMERQLDRRTSGLLRTRIEDTGIRIRTGARLEEIQGDRRVEAVLAGGESIPAELVVLSAGVRANTEIARRAGLVSDRFVRVNAYLETSGENVYACGDCAACQGIPCTTWTQAVEQGKTAGANAAGRHIPFESVPDSIVLHTADTALFATGDLGKGDSKFYEWYFGGRKNRGTDFMVNQREAREGETVFSFCFSEERLVGVALIGELSHLDFFQKAVCNGMKKKVFLKAALERGIRTNVE